MELRNPFAFALAILCLVSSASLGVLVHDGAVGFTDMQEASVGDDVRFKAAANDSSWRPFLSAWDFYGTTADLLDANGVLVVVLHDGEPLPEGAWVVTGLVRGHMAHDGHSIPIVRAEDVTSPILFA